MSILMPQNLLINWLIVPLIFLSGFMCNSASASSIIATDLTSTTFDQKKLTESEVAQLSCLPANQIPKFYLTNNLMYVINSEPCGSYSHTSPSLAITIRLYATTNGSYEINNNSLGIGGGLLIATTVEDCFDTSKILFSKVNGFSESPVIFIPTFCGGSSVYGGGVIIALSDKNKNLESNQLTLKTYSFGSSGDDIKMSGVNQEENDTHGGDCFTVKNQNLTYVVPIYSHSTEHESSKFMGVFKQYYYNFTRGKWKFLGMSESGC